MRRMYALCHNTNGTTAKKEITITLVTSITFSYKKKCQIQCATRHLKGEHFLSSTFEPLTSEFTLINMLSLYMAWK